MTSLSGCGSLWKARERIVFLHDTTTVHHRDSIHLRDSIYIREWIKGDTVFVDRFHDRFVYRDRWRDSIHVQHDTTVINHTKEVRVEKSLTWWQKFRLRAFWWLLGGVALAVVWMFREPLLSILKRWMP